MFTLLVSNKDKVIFEIANSLVRKPLIQIYEELTSDTFNDYAEVNIQSGYILDKDNLLVWQSSN